MKRCFVVCLLCFIVINLYSQDGQTLRFNSPYTSFNNRSVILPTDRIPNEFLECTLGVTTEADALKNLYRLGIQCDSGMSGASETLTIRGDIECEGAKFMGADLWFYNNIFWKIVFWNLRTDSKILASTIRQKYSRFSCVKDRLSYIRYVGISADLVHNDACLQYTIRGGSCIKFED